MEGAIIKNDLNELTIEIIMLKQQTAQNIIEIGKRLIRAKEVLQHAEWGNWLEGKVEFKERTAQNFMRVAREFSNTQAIADLQPTKIFALLDVPEIERESFITDQHEVNGEKKTVDEMTTRELQKVIKEKKEAEEKAARIQKENEEFRKKLDIKTGALEAHKVKLKEIMEKSPAIIEKEVAPADYQEAKKERELLQVENARLNLLYQEVQNQLEKEKVKSVVEEVPNKKVIDVDFKEQPTVNIVESPIGLDSEEIIKLNNEIKDLKEQLNKKSLNNNDVPMKVLSEKLKDIYDYCQNQQSAAIKRYDNEKLRKEESQNYGMSDAFIQIKNYIHQIMEDINKGSNNTEKKQEKIKGNKVTIEPGEPIKFGDQISVK